MDIGGDVTLINGEAPTPERFLVVVEAVIAPTDVRFGNILRKIFLLVTSKRINVVIATDKITSSLLMHLKKHPDALANVERKIAEKRSAAGLATMLKSSSSSIYSIQTETILLKKQLNLTIRTVSDIKI